MMCCGKERGRNFWIKGAIFIPIAIAAGVFIFGSAVMLLWNALLPAVLGVSTITFWQALGILVLSKILFGGFRCGHGHHRCHGHDWHEKWMHLSPEEREKMKAEWRGRCEPAASKE
jgi:Ca2+/H+ antiporter, TMEM165/GDT1 family